jgi:hypothetical protein
VESKQAVPCPDVSARLRGEKTVAARLGAGL